MAIITIFGGAYCHADDIADAVSKRLDYELIEDKLIDLTAERYSISRDKLLKSIKGQATFFNKLTHDREKNIARLKLVLAELTIEDNMLLKGNLGHLFPKTISHVLRTCIIANFSYRVKQAAKEKAVSENEAEKMVHKDDREHLEWTGYLFNKPPYDETLYDLIIPMHSTSVGEAVDTICQYATGEQIKTTPRSRKAAEDFVLAATVELALAEEGHFVDAFSEDGQVILTINKDVLRMSQYQEELKKIVSKIDGVSKVETRIGPKFQASSLNPWANIKIPPKILLVDDEKDFVQTLSERLLTRNIESSVVYDGEQALDFVQKDEPDVMVLDLMMPGIDGIEVLRRVKKEHPQIEVIILTGHGSKREEEQAEDLGAFAYLRKPVNIDLLARVMNEAYQKINRSKTGTKNDRAVDDAK